MEPPLDYYSRFPSVLKSALIQQTVNFLDSISMDFQPLHVFRGITRKKGDNTIINHGDFLSQMEKGVGQSNDISTYSCSVFTSKEELQIAYHLPRNNRKIIKGTIEKKYGPILCDNDNKHVDWWLFEGSDPSKNFEVDNDE